MRSSAPAIARAFLLRRRWFPNPRYHRPMPDVDWIRDLCLSFPDAAEDMPWPEDLCFKVRGKIFASLALSDGRFPRITLKCSPETFHELLETEGIIPAPYVGRHKWIQIANSNLLPARELEHLIRQSYQLISATAPKKAAPQKAGHKKAACKRRPKRKPSKSRARHQNKAVGRK